jgi:hypothetical protein
MGSKNWVGNKRQEKAYFPSKHKHRINKWNGHKDKEVNNEETFRQRDG